MILKRNFVVFLCMVLLLSMAGCSSGKGTSMEMEAPNSAIADSAAGLTKEESSAETALPDNRKLIQTVNMSAETENMDDLLTKLNEKVASLEGYIEGQNIYNGSAYDRHRYRSAELTIRIPADKLDQFVEQVSAVSNIISSDKTVEDVTLQYVATDSRVKALEAEETSLLELLEKASNMNDLLTIKSRLSEVRTELEKIKTTLNIYDNQVSYGTVHVRISEVTEYTVTEEPTTVWGRIGAGFMESLQDLGNGFVDLFVFLAVNIPYIVLIGVLGTAAILLIRIVRKKKKAKKLEAHKEPEDRTGDLKP